MSFKLTSVTISEELYQKLTKDLPRHENGKIRYGFVRERFEWLINLALDRETQTKESESKRS